MTCPRCGGDHPPINLTNPTNSDLIHALACTTALVAEDQIVGELAQRRPVPKHLRPAFTRLCRRLELVEPDELCHRLGIPWEMDEDEPDDGEPDEDDEPDRPNHCGRCAHPADSHDDDGCRVCRALLMPEAQCPGYRI